MPKKKASKGKKSATVPSRKTHKGLAGRSVLSSKKKVKPRALRVSKKAAKKAKKIAKAVIAPKQKKTAVLNSTKSKLEAIKSGQSSFDGKDRRSKRRDNVAVENENEYENTADRSAMRIYLDQIEHIPLLTPDEEISLARLVQAGGPEGDKARERMIKSNLRLVIAIAKRYSNMGLPFSDLVEEGNMGLMRAVEKFDPERGYRFSTYSSWWIKQGIMRSLSNQGKTIRIPVYMYDIIAKWRKVRDGLTQRLGRVPNRKEIAETMEVPVEKIKEIEQITERPSSLNAPISIEGSAELIDLIEEDSTKNPDSVLGEVLRSERVTSLLSTLDEREQKILTLRFGLGEGHSFTLEEVASHFDITRERVRQIEAAALKKIRKHLEEQGDKLENYISR